MLLVLINVHTQSVTNNVKNLIPNIEVVHQGFRQTGGSRDGVTSPSFCTEEGKKGVGQEDKAPPVSCRIPHVCRDSHALRGSVYTGVLL